MQQVWLALLGGLILGWLIEWIIDWQFWRRNVADLREENQALRKQLAEAQARLAALQPPKATSVPAGIPQAPTSQGAGVPPATKPNQVTSPGAASAVKPSKPAPSAPPADPRHKGQ